MRTIITRIALGILVLCTIIDTPIFIPILIVLLVLYLLVGDTLGIVKGFKHLRDHDNT